MYCGLKSLFMDADIIQVLSQIPTSNKTKSSLIIGGYVKTGRKSSNKIRHQYGIYKNNQVNFYYSIDMKFVALIMMTRFDCCYNSISKDSTSPNISKHT